MGGVSNRCNGGMDWNGGMDYGIFAYSRWHHFLASFISLHNLRRVSFVEGRLLAMYRACPLELTKYALDL